MKTADLTGAALDWAVAKCEGMAEYYMPDEQCAFDDEGVAFEPSCNWAQGGPIIEREEIAIWPDENGGYFASANEGASKDYHAETYLIAAMRCYVASKLGDEIELPEELMTHA
jgi:hypothetical protein